MVIFTDKVGAVRLSSMRILATILLSTLFISASYSQDTKGKKPAAKTKTTGQSKTAKPKSPSAKSNASASKAKPASTKKPDEKSEWDAASAISDHSERITALKRFVEGFPESSRKTEAAELIAAAYAALGNEKLQAGDAPGAADYFKSSVAAAPSPISESLFTEYLSKFPANIYFRGLRSEAVEIAKALETKSATSVSQLLSIAAFYMSIENGTEAKRVAAEAIKLDEHSSAAYQALGLAHRMDFQLEDSAAAYAKAIELDPGSLTAKRGLAEMNRSLGKPDEAVTLYRDILSTDPSSIPARTGLVLSLFDAGKRAEAEEEMVRVLEASPGNVILLAGAAYWYAVQGEGDRAVETAQKAIASDPRFVWSHIALARGHMNRNDPIAAEKALLTARRYGNFPTLEYELASARMAAGYYREASEELAKSFVVKDGVVHANIGGRVPRESRDFTELVGYERRASIFAPTAADNPEASARLTALLEFKQGLDKTQPESEAIERLADGFIKGDDKMKLHRQLFVATRMLEKKVAPAKVAEIAKAAAANIDAGLSIRQPSVAVMATELYANRSLASLRGEYINVPDVPRSTLSAILRGRVEEIIGWAALESDDAAEAVIRLKRAVSVLPADSSWWRSSTWRLGSALVRAGKDAEALDWYVKSYKSTGANKIGYEVVAALYEKVHGNLDGLESRIGANPSTVAAVVTKPEEAAPAPSPAPTPVTTTAFRRDPNAIPSSVPVARATPSPSPEPIPVAVETANSTSAETTPSETALPTPSPTPEISAEPLPTPAIDEPKPSPSVEPSPEAIATPSPSPISPTSTDRPEQSVEKTPEPTPVSDRDDSRPSPPVIKADPSPTAEPTAEPTPERPQPPPPVAEPATGETPRPTPDPNLIAINTESKPALAPLPEDKQGAPPPSASPVLSSRNTSRELFSPVVITIPKSTGPEMTSPAVSKPEPALSGDRQFPQNPPVGSTTAERRRFSEFKTTRSESVPPCKLVVSEEYLTIRSGGGGLAVIVGLENDAELVGLTAISTSPADVTARRENIPDVKSRALYVISSLTGKTGVFQVKFSLPCGEREIVVRVRQQ